MDWKTQCYKDISSYKIELQIQSNANQNPTRILGRNRKADSKIDMQMKSQGNLDDAGRGERGEGGGEGGGGR